MHLNGKFCAPKVGKWTSLDCGPLPEEAVVVLGISWQVTGFPIIGFCRWHLGTDGAVEWSNGFDDEPAAVEPWAWAPVNFKEELDCPDRLIELLDPERN